ncbi:WXG100 family type VII secretion target [Streptomyces sp. NPDC057694]|uniref:WXG100 family type VII secretion target n=1 Tax=Streptomyces sp. NPDC057694 TaxID=3346216 RepID=UPI0036AC217C
MAGSGFDIDPAVLKDQGSVFTDLGADFKSATDRLKSSLEAAEADWGEDIIGTFADIYEPVRDGMLDSMEHLSSELDKIGNNLVVMGAQYELTEDDQAQSIVAYGAQRPDITY